MCEHCARFAVRFGVRESGEMHSAGGRVDGELAESGVLHSRPAGMHSVGCRVHIHGPVQRAHWPVHVGWELSGHDVALLSGILLEILLCEQHVFARVSELSRRQLRFSLHDAGRLSRAVLQLDDDHVCQSGRWLERLVMQHVSYA